MTSPRIERTWIRTGGYGWFRAEWVNKPAMCKISHRHFFSIMLFVLPFRTEHSTYFILSKVCHFVGTLKHNNNYYYFCNKRTNLTSTVGICWDWLEKNLSYLTTVSKNWKSTKNKPSESVTQWINSLVRCSKEIVAESKITIWATAECL